MSAAYEHQLLGRDPRPGDLLDRHLHRVGADRTAHQDPVSALQVNLLRMFLDVLHSACDDERLDPAVTRRILDKVIYGGVPQQPMVEQLLAERTRFAEYMPRDVGSTVAAPPPDEARS